MNAWDKQLTLQFREAIEELAQDDAVRALVLTGNGRAFSAGADLKAGFDPTPEGHPDVGDALRTRYHPVIKGIRTMPKPVVAAVNGAAAGIGCSVALACDLVLAAESAFFSLAFVNIGLMPDGGSTLFVPAAVGKARAFEMAMLGGRISAPEAKEWGLINHVYPDDRLRAEADALVAKLAQGPTRSYAGTKQALNRAFYGDMDAQLDLEAELQHALARTQDFMEGVGAFVEKRDPGFTGQ
jgi:2-(1,2-epoxy-1,2-dihydrophenyl)acetyl-CoA isomerase